MSGFTLFKRGECPICSGNSKGCRQSNTTDLIFCRDAGSSPTDYLYRGEDSWGFNLWQYKADADIFSQQASEEKQRRRREFLEAESRRRQQQIAQQLSAVERDKWYRKLLDHLKLAEADRDSLLQRGFPVEQIIRDGYRSVTKFEKLGTGYPINLPGILTRGFGTNQILNVGGDGILCPIRDQNGLIVGCQLRLNDCTDGRYRWLTSATQKNPDGATSHLNGELPLGIFEPDHFEGDSTIWMVEGTLIKPSLTRYRLGIPVVGAASGRFNASPETAKAAVEYLCTKYQTKTLTFAIDAGDILNNSGVPERWLSQFEFFQDLGYECRFAWWGQVTKEHDDVDELDDTSVIGYITPDEFWGIVEEYRGFKEESQNGRTANVTSGANTRQSETEGFVGGRIQTGNQENSNKSRIPSGDSRGGIQSSETAFILSSSKTGRTVGDNNSDHEKWIKRRKFTPNIKLNQDKFRFPEIPDSNVIVAVKSGLGTGKTAALLELIRTSNRGAHLIGYRNNLLIQTIERGGKTDVVIYHLREDDGHALVADELTHQAYCLDSIHHLDGYFAGKDIYLDETCSILLHAVSGGTLGDGQAKAIRIFTRALEVCNRIFLLDGNLADIHVDFVAKVAKNKRVIKIENQRKIAPHTIKIVEGIDEEFKIKQRDKSPLIKFMLDPDVIPWIFSDSKERTQVLNEILIAKGKTGYVLNSETAGEDWAKEFLKDPNKFITERKPGFVIVSPSGESGISVTIKGYFTHKFSFFVGVQGTNSQHQSMFRLRDNTIPHYVFCPEHSSVRDRSTPHTYSAKRLQEIINDRIFNSAILASQSSDNPVRVLEVIGDAIARQNDHWWEFSSLVGSLDNYEMDNLRKCLIHALEDAGHDVEVIQWDIDAGIKGLESAMKEKVQRTHAKEIYDSVEFESVEKARQKAKTSPKKETQRRIERTFLLDRLPAIKDSELWGDEFIYECHIKNRDFISQQQRYWLVNNVEVSQKRHESQWFYQATNEDFFSARVKRMSHDVIWGLQQLNIMQFVGIEYHKNSPEVVDFINLLRQRTDIQLALRINHLKPETSNGKERIEIIGNLLSLIGLKNDSLGQKFVGKVRLRHYTANPNLGKISENLTKVFDLSAARLAILEAIERKFTAWMESEKSQVNWEPEQPAASASNATENSTPTPAEIVAEKLRTLQSWGALTLSQEEISLGWQLLTLSEQQRLQQLYEQWQYSATTDKFDFATVVDNAIKQYEPFFQPENINPVLLWARRLNRASSMGAEVMKSLYEILPQQILNDVWQRLTVGVQSSYCEVFAT